MDRAARRADSLGLILMVASAACFAAMAPFSRKWLRAVDPQSIVLARAIVMTLVFGIWGAARGVDLRGRDRGGLALRGLIGYFAISCYVWSTQHLPSGLAVLLQYSHPVFVAALAPLLLKEKPGPGHWPLVVAGFAGLAIALGFGGSGDGAGLGAPRVALVGLIGALLSGVAYLTVRRISATETPTTIVFWFALVMLPGSLIGSAVPWSPLDWLAGTAASSASTAADAHGAIASLAPLLPVARHALPHDSAEWLGCAGLVLAGLFGQVTLTEGLARAGAARAVAVTMSGPLFGLLFDAAFFGARPTASALGGTLLVVAALALLAVLKPKPPARPDPSATADAAAVSDGG